MTKQSPKTGKEFVQLAEQADHATVKRISGSHHYVEFDDGTGIPIPVHGNRQLGKGMLHKIRKAFKTAGILVLIMLLIFLVLLVV